MNLVNTWQEAYSGVGCKVFVLCDTLQIHVLGESVARESRTWGTVVGFYKNSVWMAWNKVNSVTRPRTAGTWSAFIATCGIEHELVTVGNI